MGTSEQSEYNPSADTAMPRAYPYGLPVPWKHRGKSSNDHIVAASKVLGIGAGGDEAESQMKDSGSVGHFRKPFVKRLWKEA